ncbi:undecaprenyl-diphosphatase [Castellaniella ginsengisoli]|uniref:Undecaprenyl-diphosphatase n=2 Tax=Castellaniella ginsengisoli TaxID=546114 RepID=A0AB39CZE8_9BURK
MIEESSLQQPAQAPVGAQRAVHHPDTMPARNRCYPAFPDTTPLAAHMETLNDTLFLWINGAAPSAAALLLGRFLANDLIYLFPLYLALNWLRADTAGREALLQAAVSAAIAMLLSWAISKAWFHPRPFVVGLGHLHMHHAPTASFPSNHLSFVWAVCAGLALHPARRTAALILALIGLPIAWARIYMGVHFPLDMAGAMLTALAAAGIGLPLRGTLVPALRRCIEPAYRLIFAWPIRLGWARA